MELERNTSVWKTLLIIIGFPILYMLFGKTTIAIELFANKNLDYYIPFWGGIIILHWVSVFAVIQSLKSEGKKLVDIGYKLSKKGTLLLIGGYLLVYLIVLVFVEVMLSNVVLYSTQFVRISVLLPKKTTHRIFFIILVFSKFF